jgi:hypothetical protein
MTEDGARKGRTALFVVAVIVALGVIVAAGVYGYRETTARRAALDQLAEATTLVLRADETVLATDEIVRAEITTDLASQISEVASDVPEAIGDLRSALDLIGTAKQNLDEERLAEADALAASATARIDMLDLVGPILEVNSKAAGALEPARNAWDRLAKGEELMDKAVAEYNKLTKDAVEASRTLSDQAEVEYKAARDGFAVAHEAFPEAGLDAFVKFAENKIALVGISKQADAAYLAGKLVEANTISDSFNAKDKELVEEAKKLSDTPETAIAAAYERLAGEPTTAYFAARDEATKADAALERVTQ